MDDIYGRSDITPLQRSHARVGTPRILVVAHSHPRLTNGGAEIAAGALAKGLRTYCGATASFLGCSYKPSTARLGIVVTQPFGEDDFVYQCEGNFDHFKFANRDPKLPGEFRSILARLEPDLIHFHHYIGLGVEAFAIAKKYNPAIKIVLTLHEFLAICNNMGQMVKTKGLHLCTAESAIKCSECFTQLTPRDFFLRKRYIQKYFAHVDLFVAPSEFLADRYVEWGVPPEKAVVLPNVLEERAHESAEADPLSEAAQLPDTRKRPFRFGFFGQMSPLKGISILIEAASQLNRANVQNVAIEIFGDYSNQPKEFQDVIVELLARAPANVHYHGPYENFRVFDLMRQVDVVVVPSIWWENSPVVIEEAFAARRPVLCSNIGGMAEKVRPGVDGWWFEAGQSHSLAATMRAVLERLASGPFTSMRMPVDCRTAVMAHYEEYERLAG